MHFYFIDSAKHKYVKTDSITNSQCVKEIGQIYSSVYVHYDVAFLMHALYIITHSDIIEL